MTTPVPSVAQASTTIRVGLTSRVSASQFPASEPSPILRSPVLSGPSGWRMNENRIPITAGETVAGKK